MKRVYIILFLTLAMTPCLFAQTATVTAQITDPSGLRYANCTYTITFKDSPNIPPGQQSTSQGIPLSSAQKTITGSCDAGGNISTTTLANTGNNSIQPAGSTWTYLIHAASGGPSFSVVVSYGSGAVNLSAQLSGSAPPLSTFAYLAFYGVPTGTCQALQLAVDVSTGNTYACNNGVWVASGGGGGGGGATFFNNAIQFATSTTTARAALSADVISLFGGCSGVLVLAANGNCVAGGGTVTNLTGPLTANNCAYGNAGNDLIVDAFCNLDGSGNIVLTSVQTTGDGVHPGFISFGVNTTDPTYPANSFNIQGPIIASMVSYGIGFPPTWGSAPPTSGFCLKVGAITAGGRIPITAASCGGGGGGTSTINLPIANAQGPNGCSLGGNAPAANLPACLLVAGTGTTTQRAAAQFCATAPCSYTGVAGGTGTPYLEYNLTMPSAGITSVTFGFRADSDTNAAHTAVFDFSYVCSAPGAVAAGTLNTAQTVSATLDGTNSHYLSAILSPTITGCAAGNLLQMRIGLDATSTILGVANLLNVQVIPQ